MAIGVGGGGGNAVNHLYNSGQKRVLLMLCNTDHQALANSPIPDEFKIQLGNGLGAGNVAANGKQSAEESIEKIKEVLKQKGIQMVFVVAGMGGGTGTGAAPVIAKAAKDMGILTVGIVTIPFEEEGRHRIKQSIEGVDEMSKSVDSLIIINNTNIVEMFADLAMSKAFYRSNEIIARAAYGIAEIVNKELSVNVDFADVRRIMSNSGVALMGTGVASGPNRAIESTEMALTSPLLQNQNIIGAKNILVCIISSHEHEVTIGDVRKITAYIQDRAQTRNAAELIWGAGYDDSLDDKLQVIVIVTGFNVQNIPSLKAYYAGTLGSEYEEPSITSDEPEVRVIPLDSEENAEQPVRQTDRGSQKVSKNNVKGGVDADSDDLYIISGGSEKSQTAGGSGASQQKVLILEDDFEKESQENEDDTPVESEEEVEIKPVQKKKPLFSGLKKILEEAKVDSDNRH